MKAPGVKPLLAALLLSAAPLRADLVIVQHVDGSGQSGDQTIRIKGDKARADLAQQVSMITNGATGEVVTLMHAQRTFLKITAAQTKAMMEQMKKLQPNAEPPKLTPTGIAARVPPSTFANGCPSEPRSGVALYVDGGEAPSVVTMDHVTIANHNCPAAAPQGAAILVEAESTLTVRNSILWGNTKEFDTLLKGKYTVANTITGQSGNGNKSGDPQFVDPANGNFHLKPGSPAIGGGTNNTNMGAYPK